MGILKLNDLALLKNCIFVSRNISNKQLTSFSNLFQISTNEQNHNTRGTQISKPVKAINYIPYSIQHKSTDDWNKLQKRNFMNFNITAITFSWKKCIESLKTLIFDISF